MFLNLKCIVFLNVVMNALYFCGKCFTFSLHQIFTVHLWQIKVKEVDPCLNKLKDTSLLLSYLMHIRDSHSSEDLIPLLGVRGCWQPYSLQLCLILLP